MRKKTKKKQNKTEQIIELLKEILAELKRLNENTNNGKLEKEWEKIYPPSPWKPDESWKPDTDSTTYPYIDVYFRI